MSKISKASSPSLTKKESVFGSKLNFAASEAYKLLRTNLMFSLPEGGRRCRVIGITSATSDEGKTTTSINLSYSLAEAGKRVLLIDADMRLPSVTKKLNLSMSPGLSNVLTGMSNGKITIQNSSLHDSMFVLASGDIPPNPSELLGAKPMEKLIYVLSENYDYIIVDLPPVNVVTDALVISPLCDGVLLVVRQDYSDRREVADTVDQLAYCKAKLLGYVLNGTDASGKKYAGHKSRYGKYYKKYGYGDGYGRGYENAYGSSNEDVPDADVPNETAPEAADKN